ncbi:hypothetical protein C1141_22005, partial [Vibrio agarivorans]
LLATLLFVSTGVTANTTTLTEQDELLINKANTLLMGQCISNMINSLKSQPEIMTHLQGTYSETRRTILENGIAQPAIPSSPLFTAEELTLSLMTHCIN